MLKKDREAITKIIKYYNSDPSECYEGGVYVHGIAKDIANYIVIDNPHFNKQKFLKACGVSDN